MLSDNVPIGNALDPVEMHLSKIENYIIRILCQCSTRIKSLSVSYLKRITILSNSFQLF